MSKCRATRSFDRNKSRKHYIDYLSAWNIWFNAQKKHLTKYSSTRFMKASCFISKINEKEHMLGVTLETTLEEKRVSRKKRMPGEQARYSVSQDPFHNFKINVYRRIVDQITTSIDERFSKNKDLIRDTACLDPPRFPEISCNGLAKESLENLIPIDRAWFSKTESRIDNLSERFSFSYKNTSRWVSGKQCQQ